MKKAQATQIFTKMDQQRKPQTKSFVYNNKYSQITNADVVIQSYQFMSYFSCYR